MTTYTEVRMVSDLEDARTVLAGAGYDDKDILRHAPAVIGHMVENHLWQDNEDGAVAGTLTQLPGRQKMMCINTTYVMPTAVLMWHDEVGQFWVRQKDVL